jgi:XTP/dITP diphosphohydrolase
VEIVVATRNTRKLEEIKRVAARWVLSLHSLAEFPGCPEVEEEGVTFEANALKKAVFVARWSQKPALADDSGLEVDALGGAPGVRSARYAGPDADDRKNIEKLLEAMRPVAVGQRGGRFVCCVALASPDGAARTFRGEVRGRIGIEPRGTNGFGYDPIFFPEGHDRTFAEMSDAEKDTVSHRAKAVRELGRYLGVDAGVR